MDTAETACAPLELPKRTRTDTSPDTGLPDNEWNMATLPLREMLRTGERETTMKNGNKKGIGPHTVKPVSHELGGRQDRHEEFSDTS